MACLAVSGESEEDPGAFLTGANCEALGTSISDTCCAIGNVSKMNSSSFTPCMCSVCLLDGAANPACAFFCVRRCRKACQQCAAAYWNVKSVMIAWSLAIVRQYVPSLRVKYVQFL